MTEGSALPDTERTAADANLLTADDLIVDQALGPDDPDALQHLPIVERVADLVAAAATPVNIALFGTWGSGKSSFAHLLQGRLAKRYPRVALVTYDSWTFEGESLQRSFISAVATGLKMPEDDADYLEFHSGLYERRRSARLTLSRSDVVKLLTVALGLFLLTLAFLFLMVAGLALLFGQDPIESAVEALPALIPATAVAGLLGSVTREIVAGARVDVDTSAPTQEQFRSTFKRLVRKARDDQHLDRIVFFIDELDRCSPEQVVQVLAAVRHFFDQPGCVYIVAADREVLEQALQQKSEQATPFNADTPYYSSASEYIDKVFQHQLSLPPLRGRRLTRFARDLVQTKRGGLWSELEGEDEGRLRDQIIYVLVPSHVRSPRRVKVLLNNFATNARVAQSRGLDLAKHATAIAKLTALRTEFPLFAADLFQEPRLPRMLLALPTSPSPRVEELLERHKLPQTLAKPEASTDLTPTDSLLTRPTDGIARSRLVLAERVNLRRYLVRTVQFPDPSRDLLFLEPAGAADDLVDQAFGELLETTAIEAPDDVIRAASDQPVEERVKALRVLADLISQEFGEERANVTTALLGIAGQLDYEIAPFGQDVLGALRLHLREEGLQPRHLAAALAVAVMVEGADHGLSDAILQDDRLMADADQVERVALIAGRIDQARRAATWVKLAEFYPDNPEVIDEPLATLPEAVAKELLEAKAVRAAMMERYNALPAADATEEIDSLIELLAAREGSSERLRGGLLLAMAGIVGNTYTAAFAHPSLPRFGETPHLL